MRETLRQRQLMAQAHLREKRAITAAQYYLLTAATVLLVLGGLVYLIITSLKLLARVEVVWWLTRSAKLDDDPLSGNAALTFVVLGNRR